MAGRWHSRSGVVRAWAAAAALLAPRLAHADPPVDAPRAALAWVRAEGAEGCPDASAVAARVRARLGVDPFATEGAPAVEAVVSREGARWRARVFIRDPRTGALIGSRDLSGAGEHCGPFADAAALSIALSVDPGTRPAGALSSSPPSASGPAGPPGATPLLDPEVPGRPPRAVRASSPAPTRDTPRVRAGDTRAGVAFGFGLVPGVAVGVAVGAEPFSVALPNASRVSVELGASHFFPQETSLAAPARRYGFSLTAFALGACWTARPLGRLAVGVCAHALGGALTAFTLQADPASPGAQPWVALAAGPRVAFALVGPVALELGLAGLVPLTQYRFRTGGAVEGPADETIFRPTRVALTGQLGLRVSIW